MKLLIPLLQQMTVFAVIAYLYSKTTAFKTMLSQNRRTRDVMVTYVFSPVSLYSGATWGFLFRMHLPIPEL